MNEKKKRIEIIDALRGFAVVLMVIHHLLYDFVYILDAPKWLFSNPVFNILHYFFAGIFIFLSGVSSRFSRSNIKRGLIVIAISAGISIVTFFMEMPIWFGVLHLLGFSMLFFGLTRKLWDMIPKKAAPVFFVILIIAGALTTNNLAPGSDYRFVQALLWVLGWSQPGFVSFDYFPLLPWLFVFLLGTWAGTYIAQGKLPEWFYDKEIPVFPAVGRKALIIYILHQQVLYGLVLVCAKYVGTAG